ncbi:MULTISPECIES: RidA family protein [Dickeya]|uniref:Endoribonuclease L-PSP n=1 Tax=Dickeya aquatica TaxID=1401087 RepID=A0A375ADR4_9GAMM|nr:MULTISPECIES: RidA family protein [Dickeya]SLM64232.1 Endoribonuclease L-PSP [Dickeya aquatica]
MKRYHSTLPYPFAKAVEANGFLFLSGQLSMDAQGHAVHGPVQAQTVTIMENIAQTLSDCGSSLQKIVKVTVWLSDMAHFQTFNDTYRTYFPDGFPARTTVISQLAFGLDVELDVQALA